MFTTIRIAVIATAFFALFPLTLASAQAANVAPTISGTPAGSVYQGFRYRFVPSADDSNGDALRFAIANKPAWADFDTSTGKLTGTPSTTGTYSNIVIKVSDGLAKASLPAFSIVVRRNHRPEISGTPGTSVAEAGSYNFVPSANDPDGQKLTFSATGVPAWASFSRSTGRLWGSPPSGSAGKTYSNILITVSDGAKSATLPSFSITIKPPSTSSTDNRAPTISGAPVTSAVVDRPYSFRPNASDLDGDPLTFTITGKPAWASFDSTNGTLYGTPTAGNVGVSSNVTIRVSDGKTSTSLAPFPITVSTATTKSATLNWTTPMQNTDGSALTNLAGYKVFYGTVSRQYSTTLKVVGPGTTSLVVEGLTQGTWFFAMQSYNNVGDVSDLGGEVSVVL